MRREPPQFARLFGDQAGRAGGIAVEFDGVDATREHAGQQRRLPRQCQVAPADAQ